MKKANLALVLVLALLSGIGLSACNTTAGAGQDIDSAGQSISKGGQDLTNTAVKNK